MAARRREYGVGVSIEGHRPWALVGKIGPTPPEMMKHWMAEQADIIKRIRNHPSVLIWTIGNEMMLRDEDNVEKWKQLSAVTKLTRELDPHRPIVVSSTYVREAKQCEKHLAPHQIDVGDVDDAHNYKGWYAASPFVTDSTYKDEVRRRGGDAVKRPLIGQEQSTGYPDLDTGLPVLRYTRDLLTPLPAKLNVPPAGQERRRALNLVTRALIGEKEVSRTVDPVEVFPRASEALQIPASISLVGGVDLGFSVEAGGESDVIVARPGAAGQLDEIQRKVEAGATAVLLAPDMKEMLKRFPDEFYDDEAVAREDFERRVAEAKAKGQEPPRKPQAGFAYDAKKDLGEFADWTPARGTTFVDGLEPMDLRWWGRNGDWKAYVSTGSFRLKPGGKARELIRYIPAHSYIPAERVPWQYRTVLFELPLGKGRLWVCNLDLAASVRVDPVADLVARNIIRAAADPASTANLKGMPSHEQMLAGKLPD